MPNHIPQVGPLQRGAQVDPAASVPFEARLETVIVDGEEALRWSSCNLAPPVLKQAAELYKSGMTVREVATALNISKSEAGRLRQKAVEGGIIALSNEAGTVEVAQ